MSTTIDERVVEMRFDNKQFEQNVQTSLSTIDRLKRSLNLTGAAKGLEDVNSTAQKCNMSPLANAVETMRVRFSALEVMAVTALSNITNTAINAGKKLVSAFTIDPVKSGFEEYETQINAVQTILANTESKGSTLKDVNSALDELNTYADKTIYNFTEMTRNIGTFTAAGVDLDTSVSAIKGIANLAAVSGSNSQQASTAMYQLSQALAAGTVKLQDWNSVVNAGMGGQVFQDALKETARAHNIAIDNMIKSEGSFRETLSKGWLTSEILTETLSKFTGDLNEEQLRTMGYTEEQISSIIKMGNTANDAATKVKTFTQLFDTLKEAAQSGWTQSWEIIVGDFEEAKTLLTEVSDTFGALINASAEARNEMLQGWKDLGGRTALIEAVKNAFEGVISIATPVKEAFKEIFPPMTAQQFYNITEGLKTLTEKFKIGETTANNLKRTFKGVFSLFDIGLQGVKALVGGLADLIGYVAPAGNGILDFTANIGDFIVGIDEAIKSSDTFNKAIESIGNFFKPISDGIKIFVDTVADAFAGFAHADTSGIDSFSDKVKTRFEPFTKLGELVKKVMGEIARIVEKIAPIFGRLSSIVSRVFSQLGDAILNALDTASFDPLLDLLNGGLFAAILVGFKKLIDSLTNITENGGGMLGSLKDILDGVKGSLEAWQSNLKAGTLLKIAGALAILTASIVALSLVDSTKLTSSLMAMTVMFAELFGSMAIFQKIMGSEGFNSMGKVAIAMLGLSTAILILSAAVINLSSLDWDGLAKGLVGVAGLSAILIVAAKALSNNSGKLIKGSVGLIIFSVAIRNLVGAVEDLGKLDVDELAKGLIGVGVLCAELALFLKTADLDGMGLLKGAGLMLLAGAINILANAVSIFANIDEGIIRGLAAVGTILAEIAIFTKLTGNAKHVMSTAIGMTILGAAMLIFGKAVQNMGSMSWEQIGRGLTTMAGALAAIIASVNLMPKGMVTKAIGMIGMATAITIVGDAVQNMGNMSWSEIAKGLVALTGSMVILTVALNAMKTALPGAAAMLVVAAALSIFTPVLKSLGEMSLGEIGLGLLALAGIFAVIGVAGLVLSPLIPVILALGAAVTLFGVGCIAVGAGILAFSAGLSALAIAGTAGAAALVVIITSIIGLIPMIIEQIAAGIIAFAGAIITGMPVIMAAVTAVAVALIQVLVDVTPNLVLAVMEFLMALLLTLESYIPRMIDSGMKIILGFLKGIANNIQAIVEAGIDIVINFIKGITSKIPEVIQSGFELIIAFINGLADAIEENTGTLIEAIGNLANAIIDGLIDGLLAGIKSVGTAIKTVANTVLTGLKEALGIHSPSKETKKLGEYTAEGFAEGLDSGKTEVLETAEDIANETTDVLNEGINAGLIEFKNHLIDGGNAAEDFWEKFTPAKDATDSVEELSESFEDASEKITEIGSESKKTMDSIENLGNSVEEASDEMKDVESQSIITTDSIIDLGKASVTTSEEIEKAVKKSKKAREESKKLFDIMSFGSDIVTDFAFRFGEAFAALGDTAPLEASYAAVEQLALTTFEASKTASEASVETAEASEKSERKAEDVVKNTVERLNKIKEAFQKMRESLSSTIKSQMDIFAEFNKKTELTADKLLKNMRSQISGVAEWANNLQTLAVKGIDQGLLKKLADMGPKGYEYVSAFVSMTGEQLTEANSLYAQSASLPESATTQIMSSFAYAGLMASQGFADGISTTAGSAEITEMGTNALTSLQTTLQEHSPSKATYAMGMNLIVGLNNGIENYSSLTMTKIRMLAARILSTLRVELSAGYFFDIGAQICNGIASGIESNSSRAIEAARNMAQNALQAAKSALEINSPSRQFVELGKFSVLGYANAINHYSIIASNAAEQAGDQAIHGLSNAISKIADIITSGIDTTPVIRPVLDLSHVDKGAKKINAIFSRSQALSINSSLNHTGTGKAENESGASILSSENKYQFIQNNYSPKSLSRIDIYRQTRNQFSMMKGLVDKK